MSLLRGAGGYIVGALVVLLIVGGYLGLRWFGARSPRGVRLGEWFLNPEAHPDWSIHAGERCGSAPFVAPFAMPTDGYVGFIWGDSFRPGHRHQGIDIFGGKAAGTTPVYAAYPGYLTRMPDWKSSVIVRIPDDPLQPGRQIWAYYTHMADMQGNSYIAEDFPAGTAEVFVEAGTLLGYQGNFSGDPFNPTGVHLHFSLVLDDGNGSFRNELEFNNTLDPSPYLQLELNASRNRDQIVVCKPD
jgi:murein DD-endopeptidase MepM/ murein hydrolase activator NlpD